MHHLENRTRYRGPRTVSNTRTAKDVLDSFFKKFPPSPVESRRFLFYCYRECLRKRKNHTPPVIRIKSTNRLFRSYFTLIVLKRLYIDRPHGGC